MSKPYRHSNEEFIKAVEDSETYSDVARKLSLSTGSKNREVIARRIKKLGLKAEDLENHKWRRGLPAKHKNREVPIEKVLVKGRKCDGHHLKMRLIKLKIFERKCYSCNLTQWLGNPIPISLEHIDGDHTNNLLENLTILCENCHALTETWRGRRRKNE